MADINSLEQKVAILLHVFEDLRKSRSTKISVLETELALKQELNDIMWLTAQRWERRKAEDDCFWNIIDYSVFEDTTSISRLQLRQITSVHKKFSKGSFRYWLMYYT